MSDFWRACSMLVGSCGVGGMVGVNFGTGILKSAPCPESALEKIMREMTSGTVEQCVTIFGTTRGEPWSDPYFQGTMCGLIGLGIATAAVAWQKTHP